MTTRARLRRGSWVARATAALSILAVTSAQARASNYVDVNLRFNDRQPPSALVEAMQLEAAAIWQVYGIDVRWHSSSAPKGTGSTLFDVLLDQTHHAGARTALGEARLPVQSSDYVAIRLDREMIEDLLGLVTFDELARLTGHANVDMRDVGRALGRVLAHELGHALVATRGHQATGLMRPAFSGEELLTGPRDSYGLSRAEVTRLLSLRRTQHEPADRHSESQQHDRCRK